MKFWMFCLLLLLAGGTAAAQPNLTTPPYQRFPTLPPLQLLLGDSSTLYTKASLHKKKPVLVMLFSPDCSHCKHTAEELVQQKEKLAGLQIVLATLHPLWQMNEFVARYRLHELPNVVVGKDIYYLLPPFYNIKNLPYLAFYDKKGKLLKGFEGSMPLEKILAVFSE